MPRIFSAQKSRGFACLLAQLPAQLPSCHNSERLAAAGIGSLREAAQTEPHAAPALPAASRPVGPGSRM
jgi:hypothetical protein